MKTDALGLIPAPRRIDIAEGGFVIDDATEITTSGDEAELAAARALARWLGVPEARVRSNAPPSGRAIALRLDRARAEGRAARDPAIEPPRDATDEAFELEVTADGARVTAPEAAGLFYGAQALAQLAGSRPIEPTAPSFAPRILPAVRIEDAPALRLRAMHLDVARHFFDVATVRRYIDLLAFYRFNVFHWHLSDDQGFRLEIASDPSLTEIGARVSGPDGDAPRYYSQDDVRRVVRYARERFITVIPELDAPGHTRAILAAHPKLSCTGARLPLPTEGGVVYEDVLCASSAAAAARMERILAEALDLFPARLVHLGGDEVPPTRWRACARCRATNLSPERLHAVFLERLAAFVRARGRRPIVWDDGLAGGLPADAIVAAWQSRARARDAASAGHDVIAIPQEATYFDRAQSTAEPRSEPGYGPPVVPWQTVLAFDPRRDGGDRVAGAGGALWTENVRTEAEIETMVLPRMAALADALWREPDLGARTTSFVERLSVQRRLLDAASVRYFVEPPIGLRPRRLFLDEATLDLAPPAIHPDGEVRFTLDGSEPTSASPRFESPIVLESSTTVSARLFLPGGRASAVTRGAFERTTLRPASASAPRPEDLAPGVRYEYFEVAVRALPDFSRLRPAAAGRLPAISLDVARREEDFAFVFEGWIRIPEDGVYRFVARADDGVAVAIDGERVVVDDGEHAARDAAGEIALARGLHAVRVEYFQAKLGKELQVWCEGEAMPLAPCALLAAR